MKKVAPDFSGSIRRIRRLLGLVVAPFGLLALLPIALLTVMARTGSGKLAGWAALSSIAVMVATIVTVRSPSRDARHVAAIVVPTLALIALVVLLYRRAPNGASPQGPGLRSDFPDPSAFRRASVWNLIPEVDQVMLGAAILTRLDPWMSTRHARRIRSVLDGLYDEMEAVPGTRSLGTVVNLAMAELLGGSFRNSGHYYAYVPENRPGERLGMIVFLHGNAGNHKVMAWAWKPFADRYKVAIVCPTFGFGFWGEGGVEAVERSREHALDTLPIDPGLVWLGGISDGGKGVTRTAAEHPERYRGLIYLSPTMLPDEVGSRPFLDGWKGRPALIFQGDDDHNVLRRDVDPAADSMRRGGIDVTYRTYPGEDHFLFFARRPEIFEAIATRLDVYVHRQRGQ